MTPGHLSAQEWCPPVLFVQINLRQGLPKTNKQKRNIKQMLINLARGKNELPFSFLIENMVMERNPRAQD